MSKISGQFQDICYISGITGQLRTLQLTMQLHLLMWDFPQVLKICFWHTHCKIQTNDIHEWQKWLLVTYCICTDTYTAQAAQL